MILAKIVEVADAAKAIAARRRTGRCLAARVHRVAALPVRRRRAGSAAVAMAVLLGVMPAAGATDRVITVGGAITEIVAALGAGDRLVAVDTTSTWPESVRALPKVGYQRSLNAEGIAALKPRILLVSGEAGPPAALAQLRTLGIDVRQYPVDHSFEGMIARVREAAGTLGVKARGEALAGELDARWKRVQAKLPAGGKPPRVFFLLAHTGNSILASGSGTAADAMIRFAGGVNAFAGFKGYKAIGPEALAAGAPDIVLVTAEGLAAIGGADRLWQRDGFAATPAGRERRLVSMDALLLLGFGPRLPEAVEELARRLRSPSGNPNG